MHSLHAMSILACWLNGLDFIYQLLLSGLVIASWTYQSQYRSYVGIGLRFNVGSGWAVSFHQQDYQAIEIKPDTVLGALLIDLHYVLDSSSGRLLIFSDTMSKNDYRRLKVLLKTSGNSREQ